MGWWTTSWGEMSVLGEGVGGKGVGRGQRGGVKLSSIHWRYTERRGETRDAEQQCVCVSVCIEM